MALGPRCRAAYKQGQQTRKHALHVYIILHHCFLAQCVPLLLRTFQKYASCFVCYVICEFLRFSA